MSYLNVPRIHFGGLFFSDPATANNFLTSRDPNVPLTNAQGQYESIPQGGPPAGWNALGVAQLWLEEARVLVRSRRIFVRPAESIVRLSTAS
ncbi:MAG TPA: hypothetical protein VN851_18670 [Thermoanaerobaculia bacterium]|nr:hypothetical protein [Thermoanaerobaculia bacterium]